MSLSLPFYKKYTMYLLRFVLSRINDVKIFRAVIDYTKINFKSERTPTHDLNIIVPVFHWFGSNVGWFQVILAVQANALGCSITFTFDDDLDSQERYSLKIRLMRYLINRLCLLRNFEILEFNEIEVQKERRDYLIIRKEYFNEQWRLRKSIDFSTFESQHQVNAKNRRAISRIEKTLDSAAYDLCLCPGGIVGNSFFWRALCKERNIRFCSFDSSSTKVLIAHDGVAAHRFDVVHRMRTNQKQISDEMEYRVKQDLFKRANLTNRKHENLHLRKTEKHFDSAQVEKFHQSFLDYSHSGEVLDNIAIFLNTSWDSAALDLEPWKVTQFEWIKMLLEEIATHGAKQITVRVHPDEKFYPSNDDYASLIDEFSKVHSEIPCHLIEAKNETNSYDLIRASTAVFTFSSTIGLEACILGKPSFVFKENYQSYLNALVIYRHGFISECLAEYNENKNLLIKNAIIVYYYSQLEGWHDISLENLHKHCSNNNFFKIAETLLNEQVLV